MKRKIANFKSGAILVVSLLFFVSKSRAQQHVSLKEGNWLGELKLQDSVSLPFHFYLQVNGTKAGIDFINATEKIHTDDVTMIGDSLIIHMPLFDSEFRCKNYTDSLKGVWINHGRKDKNSVPFIAYYNRTIQYDVIGIDIAKMSREKWEVTFSPGTADSSKAIGSFFGINGSTFMTESGDYRYLTSEVFDNQIYLSCFDGTHAYYFKGIVKNDSLIDGEFWAGSHWHEHWIAKRNPDFSLADPDSLTSVKAGFGNPDFQFKNLDGKTVSLSDERYKNKVVIIQIMGSWCPNCMDETAFLAKEYEKYKKQGLEVIALAFERTPDFAKSVVNVSKAKNRFQANYEFLITGKTGSAQAGEVFPMLSKISAFPTTIYLDRSGKIRKVYTGYYGPATGEYHTRYVNQTTHFIESLLAE